MDTYVSGTQTTATIPLINRDGAAFLASSVSYRVVDQAGLEVIALTSVAGHLSANTSVSITVSALINTLSAGLIRGARIIELTCLTGGNTIRLTFGYMVESPNPLVIGVNSFQTLGLAELSAYEMFNLDGWRAAASDQRVMSLIEARSRIGQLNLVYRTQATSQSRIAGADSRIDLLALTQAEFLALPADMIKALQMAQVAEASDILEYSGSLAQKRADGLMLDTIGEVKQMYRSGKPLETTVCRQALGYLSKYLSYSVNIGRA